MQLKLNGIQHIGIPVTDMAASMNFYWSLGFTNVMKSPFTFEREEGICVMMRLGQMIIELYQMPRHKLDEIKNRRDGHIDHVAFDVDDIDHTFQILQTAGFSIIESSPVFLDFWEKGCRYFNILGPDGERIEFNQILK